VKHRVADHQNVRRVRRIVVVSGPSCVGKTTFIARIKAEPSLRAHFGLDGIPAWISDADQLRSLLRGDHSPDLVPCLYELRTGQMFLTYDHNMLWIRGHVTYDRDRSLRELGSSSEVVVVTMWEHPVVLLHRCDNRIRELLVRLARLRRFRKHLNRLRLHLKMRSFYAKPSAVWRQYCRWFAFCDARALTAHWIVRSTGPGEIVEWSGGSEPLWEHSR
jgi:hypothetical protein